MEEIICEAIRGRTVIHFNYRGGGCTVEPHCLGTNNKGDLTLLGYQCSGHALLGTTGQGANWVPFPVDRLSDLKLTELNFVSRPKSGLKETIVEIICCIDDWI